jgi:hypothetical protein
MNTLSNTFYITGVQVEVGSVATPFERRPYGLELALCQRYYFKSAFGAFVGTCLASVANRIRGHGKFSVTMRTTPSITFGATDIDNVAAFGSPTADDIQTDFLTRVTVNNGVSGRIGSAAINADAEL